eukprot:10663264-Alexandrium_andersonii.AAC.1
MHFRNQINNTCEASQPRTVIDEIEDIWPKTKRTQESMVDDVEKPCEKASRNRKTKRVAT